MSAAADTLVDTAPEDITEEAQAFADAIDGLEQYAAEQLRSGLGGRRSGVPVR